MRSGFSAALAAALVAGAVHAGELKPAVDRWRAAHETEIVARLDALTRMRSIAADPAATAATAFALKSELARRGFDSELLTAAGAPPVVFGALPAAGAKRTVVFYAHYDGQPVTPAQWRSDPFDPVMRSGPLGSAMPTVDWKNAKQPLDPQWRLFGRAVADDKTSIVAFLAAFDALQALGRKPSVNVKVVWEGEEEAGSDHLGEMLRPNRARLSSDLWLIGDAPVHPSRAPTLYFGARGIIGVELTIYGPLRALHDGHYGNWAPNPAAMAAGLIAQMRDDGGGILIPGFLDAVRPLTGDERAALEQTPPIENDLRQQFGLARSEGTQGVFASVMRPALNVRGIRSGQVGAESANAIPVDAIVAIDFRLVPDQAVKTVQQQFEDFLRAKGWTVASEAPDTAARLAHPRIVKVSWQDGYPALRSDMGSATARAVIAAAAKGAGRPPVLLPMMGASVPIYLFAELFKVPVIGVPIVNHDDNQHAANENIRLQNIWDGIDTYASLLAELDW